ncbi:glutamate-gated chloride channel subunit beta-like [Panulirus ornatus]|uniref:glutamate-gated chloride channel subunit beta-like n=1 Tax=Panulirus ornatus TaxID=150431 RepID=UPI003A8C256B
MLTVGGEGVWADFKCYEKIAACAACQERQETPLYIRGTCHEMKTKTMFEMLGYSSHKPYFHGFHGHMITYSEKDEQWIMSDTVANSTLARLTLASSNLYPIGRHKWSLAAPLCDHPVGSQLELSLSICKDGQYMCDDGQCIEVAARCDAKDDCADETDEDHCSILKIPAGYRSFKPPKNTEQPSLALQPDTTFRFLRFLKIEDVQRAIDLEFIVTMSWVDSRLKYLNLRSDIHSNKLSAEERTNIWRPQLDFTNVKDGELKLLKDDIFVQRVGEPLPVDFNAVNMDKMYKGGAARITQIQHYSGSFVCSFDVFYYPFDMQRCSVLLQLSSLSKQLVRFTDNRSTAEYGQDRNLPMYLIGDFYAQDRSNTNRESLLEVGYTLTRRYTFIVLSVFMPSTMLLTIGYATLYVKIQLLQVRLVVSLTTLLVLYTFFNQTSSSLPKTAYVKMIDVWFFFCTILLFAIIVVHVMVEHLESEAVTRVGPKHIKSPSHTRLTAEGLLRLFRLLVVPLAVLVFAAVYWTTLLRQ